MSQNLALRYKGMELAPMKTTGNPETAYAKWEETLLNLVADCNDIEVPTSKVENEINGMVAELYAEMRYDSLTTGTPHYNPQQEVQEQMDEIRQTALRHVKLDMILKEIIKIENLEVSKEELLEEAKDMSQRQQIPLERIIDFFGEDLTPLRSDLLTRKAIAVICENAVIM